MPETRVPLAIVGIGCRMPGGINNPDDLWKMISGGNDGICEVPSDRWDWRRYYSADTEMPGKIYVRNGGFLQQDIKTFDAEFFGISPREAMTLDPQQRLLLETTWEAIEDAGLTLDRLAGSRTGVYIGALTVDNMLTQMSPSNCGLIGPHSAASSTMTMLSNRLSYFLDLRGPSLSIDTACSSSLVAFHLACQSIWARECEMALVGAANVMFRPEYMVAMCKGQFLAPDGRSKSFDARANGYGRGEGAGVILVKPLEAAVLDGDRIYALVRATGSNQDGRTNGITVPNQAAQQELIQKVLAEAGVPVSSISYIEAHGTGTPVGDPIEARAIGQTLGQGRQKEARLPMSSVKANIGHLEAASGVAGLIKLCMCFKYSAIPPLANLGEPNPAIPFDELGLRLPASLEPLPQNGEPLRFAINSFGYGGTNAHAILENAPVVSAAAVPTLAPEEIIRPALLPLSARSEKALRELVARYRETLLSQPGNWARISAVASSRRTHHNFRVAFTGRSCEELIGGIDKWLASVDSGNVRVRRLQTGHVAPVIVFSGMGPQWWGMGQQLFECEPFFREFVLRADEEFKAVSGWSIVDEMRRDKDTSRINQTIYAQPAIFVLQAGLYELLKSWGINPSAVLGHSLGENAAAYTSGALTLRQAVFVGYHRSQILGRAAGLGGGMLAVGLSEEEAQALIAPYGDRATIAAVNAPKSVTLAGETEALNEIASRLQVQSIFNRALQVEVAYHSAYMTPLQQPLIEELRNLHPAMPSIAVYSSVTGKPVTELSFDGAYWAENIRQPVQFVRALQSAIADGHQLFLEIGAHPALTPSIRDYIARNNLDAQVVSTLVRNTDEVKTLFESLATLYTAGCDLDWNAVHGGPCEMVSLPQYPWQREMYWEETESALEQRIGGSPAGLAGHALPAQEPTWERTVSNRYMPYLDDHVVQDFILLPGSAYVDIALGLARQADAPFAVENLQFRRPLVVDRDGEMMMRTRLDPVSRRIVFHAKPARADGAWTEHAEARLSVKVLTHPASIDLNAVRARANSEVHPAEFYTALEALGLNYGPCFQRIIELYAGQGEVLAKLEPPSGVGGYDIDHVIHPALLDSAFHSLLAARSDAQGPYVPESIGQIAVFGDIPDAVWSHGYVKGTGDAIIGSIELCDGEGRVFATVKDLRCVRVAATANSSAILDKRMFHPVWRKEALEPAGHRVGTWLLLAEGGFPEGSFPDRLSSGLRNAGCEAVISVCVDMGEGATSDIAGYGTLRSHEDWSTFFTIFPASSIAGIAYVTRHNDLSDPGSVMIRAGHLREMFQQLTGAESGARAYLLMQDVQAVASHDMADGCLQASAAGFFRVAHNEIPGLKCSVVDHDGCAAVEQVVAELLTDDVNDDVAIRSGSRFVMRIEACTQIELEKRSIEQLNKPGEGSTRFTIAGPTSTSDRNTQVVHWREANPAELADDEVEIRVAYMQSDSHNRQAGASGQPALLRNGWREFTGTVTRTGKDVHTWAPGDRVAAAAICQLASHVVVKHDALRATTLTSHPSPDSSRIAITSASANVALSQTGEGRPGETILVIGTSNADLTRAFQGEAGRIGMRLIMATANRDASGLDVYSDGFAAGVLAANSGKPVDMVVFCAEVDRALHNSLPLAAGGRIVLYGPAISSINPDCFFDKSSMYSLYQVDPAALLATNSISYQRALKDARPYPAADERVCGADELCSDASYAIGNGALTVDMTTPPRVVSANAGSIALDPEAQYVITGGFGGFGLVVADHLIRRGARNLVLIGRSGVRSETAKKELANWREHGVSIREALLDVADPLAVDALFSELAEGRPVKGIMHAAGVVDDTRIADMTTEQLARVIHPKVHGALNLHQASERYRLPLEHFVLFSSAASLVGNAGQANYVTANAVMDALAGYRQARGLAGASINWGALAEVGMAIDEGLKRQFTLMGIVPLRAEDAMTGFDTVLRFGPAQIGIMDIDWVQWGKFEPTGGKSPRLAHLTGRRGGASTVSLAESLRQLPEEERVSIVEIMLAEQLATTLRISVERLDVKRPLAEMGIDSLMAVEIQIGINMVFGVEFSTLELARGLSVSQMAGPLLDRMGIATARAGSATPDLAVSSSNHERLPPMEGRPMEHIAVPQTVGQ